MDKQKKEYDAPQLTVATFKVEQGYAASGRGILTLGDAWDNYCSDAWDGSTSGSNGGRFGSGWTDNGSSAWE